MHVHPALLCISSLCSLVLSAPQENCTSCAPNPIATTYPSNITGTINGTIGIISVPIAYARSLLPSRLAPHILTHAYTRFSIPPTHYPLTVEGILDHDLRFQGVSALSDFSGLRLTFPFIDLLGDGSTCFRYSSYHYLPPTGPLAIAGSQAYGEGTINATFDPPDAPYKYSPIGAKNKGNRDISLDVYAGLDQLMRRPPAVSLQFAPACKEEAYPLALYKNITNQPFFGNKTGVCLAQINFWNTSVTRGKNAPVNIKGSVSLSAPLTPKHKTFKGVRGVAATRAFLENNEIVSCEQFKGYKGTGSGDSG